MLLKLISECSDYDFKEKLEVSKPKSWLKTISAFSNGLGGTLFFGVSNDKRLVGVENSQYVCDKISELIYSKISPVPSFVLEPYTENDLIYIAVRVFPGTATPYYFSSDGVREAYFRSGNQSVIAPRYILEELILKGNNKTYDSILTSFLKEDYSFTYFETIFRDKTFTKICKSDYISFSLMNEEGYLTNAGVLLSDQNIYRHSRVFCTRWNGLNKASLEEASNDAEYSGCLVYILDSALNFIKANTKKKWKKAPEGRIEMPEYDDISIREVIVNALIHRQYTNNGSEVTIDIFDNRIVVTSPGPMASGLIFSVEPNTEVPSIRRNPILADVFARIKLMDRRGSGLDKIRYGTNRLFNDNKNHVEFYAAETHFSVVIYSATYNLDEEEKKEGKEKGKEEGKEKGEEGIQKDGEHSRVGVEKGKDKGKERGKEKGKEKGKERGKEKVDEQDKECIEKSEQITRKILDQISQSGTITIAELADALSTTEKTIRYYMNKLRKNGIIRRIGSTKKGIWIANDNKKS